MNILHHKSWHVRNKDNIARVRRDEAKAAEEEKELERRTKLAEQEARMSLLRNMAADRMTSEQASELQKLSGETESARVAGPSARPNPNEISTQNNQHVNFFSELEAGETSTPAENKEREAEKKKEQEEYEKKMGILVQLGQDTNELTGEKSWWEKVPSYRQNLEETTEKNTDSKKQDQYKDLVDPLNTVRRYLGTEGVQGIIKKSRRNEQSEKLLDINSKKDSKRNSEKSKKKKKKKDKKKDDYESKRKSHHHKKKSKKRRRYSSSSSSNSSSNNPSTSKESDELEKIKKQQKLEKLRMERLQREEKSRARANHTLYGIPVKDDRTKDLPENESKQKYNNQFNPQFAKQNKLNANQKYWLE